MSQLITLIGLALFHFITGYGVLYLFKVKLRVLPYVALSTIVGVLVASLVPFLLQLLYIRVTAQAIFLTWGLAAAGLNLKVLLDLFKGKLKWNIRPRFPLKIYEIPAICMLAFIIFVSAWRCYYYPTYARDTMAGPEAIAEYAVREHTLINSVFNVDLSTTNNQFKSPFLTDLQVIYKYAGFPFGGVWLINLVVSFFIFLYYALSEKLHPVLTGLLLLCFIATPEAYAYTFMYLYDYSNMILLFLGFYYLFSYFKTRRLNEFYFSALLMAFAIYIRSETIAFVMMTAPLTLYAAFRSKEGLAKPLMHIAIFLLIGLLIYWIPGQLYNNHYLPQAYQVGDLINKNITDLDPLFQRFNDINEKLLFGKRGAMLWGNFIYLFLILLVAELVIKRSLTRDARNWLIAVLMIYVGLPVLGFLLPLMDLDNTTKRGLFKILPLMLLYMANNQLLIKLSEIFYKWEGAEAKLKPA